MSREAFTASVPGGELAGWVEGDGEPVLLLHGGPGVPYGYLDMLAAELVDGYRVAAYQQRGLEPSTVAGPFGIAQEIDDVGSVLDALGFQRPWLIGHSWGGHLALRLAAVRPERFAGILAVDPLGVVGDGGTAAFAAEMSGRLESAAAARIAELDAIEEAEGFSQAVQAEYTNLVWPSYFAHPDHTFPVEDERAGIETMEAIFPAMTKGLDEVAAAIAEGDGRLSVLAGGASPMPWGQVARAIANLSPRIQLTVEPAAGHFPWFEAPGCVRRALDRLRTS